MKFSIFYPKKKPKAATFPERLLSNLQKQFKTENYE